MLQSKHLPPLLPFPRARALANANGNDKPASRWRRGTVSRVLVIDNYDSFTWNLVHLISRFTRDNHRPAQMIRRAHRTCWIAAMTPSSSRPAPAPPNEAGICLDLIREGAGRVPIFGVCLGMQAIGQAFGADIVRAPLPLHGKTSLIRHRGEGVFAGCPESLEATRYHSLVIARESCPAELVITAESDDGLIMGVEHRTLPVCGVQFHPESIMTPDGGTLLGNFFDKAARWRNRAPAAATAPA